MPRGLAFQARARFPLTHMPSGKVHDKITVATAALAAPAVWLLTPSHDPLTSCAAVAGYVFGGLWMSDDLDTHSVAYKRWGALRILWWPYKKLVPHRSWISHGLGVGPLLRVAYFTLALYVAAHALLGIINTWIIPLNRDDVLRQAAIWLLAVLSRHQSLAAWALGGLIAAGIAHGALDRAVSTAKKLW
ncbi:MAG: metal-binding protein [Capsulimonadaceae bacterium]|nr:metal-binding protein [Capsulimonadaceae bacterium]